MSIVLKLLGDLSNGFPEKVFVRNKILETPIDLAVRLNIGLVGLNV